MSDRGTKARRSSAATSRMNTRAAQSATPVEKRDVPRDKLWLSVGALAVWILLFAAGLLIETVEYRLALAPRSVAKQLGPQELKSVPGQNAAVALTEEKSQPALTVIWRVLYSMYAFFAALVCFTPINLALLTLAAGLVGGCASNIAIETLPDLRRADLASEHPRRALFLQEPPISAAIRGFIVYLCVIAGLYVAMDDPFKDPTPGQYIRLAGTLSIMAFIVGYDASRLEDWFRAIPGPTGRSRASQGRSTLNNGSNSSDVATASPRPKRGHAELDGKPPHSDGADLPETQQEAAAKEAAAG